MQNLALGGFSAEQFWQRIDSPLGPATAPPCITRRDEGAEVRARDYGRPGRAEPHPRLAAPGDFQPIARNPRLAAMGGMAAEDGENSKLRGYELTSRR